MSNIFERLLGQNFAPHVPTSVSGPSQKSKQVRDLILVPLHVAEQPLHGDHPPNPVSTEKKIGYNVIEINILRKV